MNLRAAVAIVSILMSAAFDMEEAFAQWDANKDGIITKVEYYKLLRDSDPRCLYLSLIVL
jgi:hypothetical protein